MFKFILFISYGKGFGLTQYFTSWNPPNGVLGIGFYILLLLLSKHKVGDTKLASKFFQ